MQEVSFYIAFVAGLLSFFSPCIFPIIPSYILFLAGESVKEHLDSKKPLNINKAVLVNSLLFILGFSIVFIVFGLTASAAGQVLSQHKSLLRVLGGGIVVIFGLYLTGVFKLPFLDLERRLNIKHEKTDYLASFLIGVSFAAAWVPCAGPVLGSILVMAGISDTILAGTLLLLAYSLGLAVPFFITALLIDFAFIYFKRINKYLWAFNLFSGIFLVLIGLAILANRFHTIVEFLSR